MLLLLELADDDLFLLMRFERMDDGDEGGRDPAADGAATPLKLGEAEAECGETDTTGVAERDSPTPAPAPLLDDGLLLLLLVLECDGWTELLLLLEDERDRLKSGIELRLDEVCVVCRVCCWSSSATAAVPWMEHSNRCKCKVRGAKNAERCRSATSNVRERQTRQAGQHTPSYT